MMYLAIVAGVVSGVTLASAVVAFLRLHLRTDRAANARTARVVVERVGILLLGTIWIYGPAFLAGAYWEEYEEYSISVDLAFPIVLL